MGWKSFWKRGELRMRVTEIDTVNARVSLLISMLGLRQDQFAEEIGENVNFISEIVEGKKNVPEKLVNKISERYGVRVEWMKCGMGHLFYNKTLNNGKKMFTDFYAAIEDDDYHMEAEHLMKTLKVLDVIREGKSMSVKDALAILDKAKDILLDWKII